MARKLGPLRLCLAYIQFETWKEAISEATRGGCDVGWIKGTAGMIFFFEFLDSHADKLNRLVACVYLCTSSLAADLVRRLVDGLPRGDVIRTSIKTHTGAACFSLPT